MTESSIKKIQKKIASLEDSLDKKDREIIKLREALEEYQRFFDEMKKQPLIIGSIERVFDDGRIIASHTPGNRVLLPPNKLLKPEPGDSVVLHGQSLQVLDILSKKIRDHVVGMELVENPNVAFEDIGGLDAQIEAIREIIELPLLHRDLFDQIGIEPPTGALLSGPPGTGKTLLAKAIATSTKARFIHLVGSDLVQKFIGEGSRMVREVFSLAKENLPAIIFIDEIDAIATKRTSEVYKGDREVQRTFMQLLSELDGFANTEGIMFLAATNREDVLDPAILRPGRFDRIVKFDMPNEEARLMILQIHTRKMNLKDVNLNEVARKAEGFSGAHIKALVSEAGIKCLRERSTEVTKDHFNMAISEIMDKEHGVKQMIYS